MLVRRGRRLRPELGWVVFAGFYDEGRNGEYLYHSFMNNSYLVVGFTEKKKVLQSDSMSSKTICESQMLRIDQTIAMLISFMCFSGF